MNDYFLFIDTETTGLPKNWMAPYTRTENWPSAVQIAWIIFTRDGQEIKRENHYINDVDVPVSKKAFAIHGLDASFLKENGSPRKAVMQQLVHDLRAYEPLAIGHYMQFDYAVINADFNRAGITFSLAQLPLFCTMLASEAFVRNPRIKYMRLEELYAALFNKKSPELHNAMQDAELTAACFFELLRGKYITTDDIQQQRVLPRREGYGKISIYLLTGLLILILFILYVLFQKN